MLSQLCTVWSSLTFLCVKRRAEAVMFTYITRQCNNCCRDRCSTHKEGSYPLMKECSYCTRGIQSKEQLMLRAPTCVSFQFWYLFISLSLAFLFFPVFTSLLFPFPSLFLHCSLSFPPDIYNATLLSFSNFVYFQNYNEPLQVHLSLTTSPNEMM